MTEMFDAGVSGDGERGGARRVLFSTSARFGAFTDAVVAIAMTLLILPLMELVPEATREHLTTRELLSEHEDQFMAFLLSFVLVGVFWLQHHRVFRADTPHTGRRALVNLAWMVTIVFLPVATAMTGSMATDRLQILIYIGTLALSSWLLVALSVMEIRARRSAQLPTPDRSLIATSLAMSLLYVVALVLAEIFPGVGYTFLVAMVFTGLLRRMLIRLGVRDAEGSTPVAPHAA